MQLMKGVRVRKRIVCNFDFHSQSPMLTYNVELLQPLPD